MGTKIEALLSRFIDEESFFCMLWDLREQMHAATSRKLASLAARRLLLLYQAGGGGRWLKPTGRIEALKAFQLDVTPILNANPALLDRVQFTTFGAVLPVDVRWLELKVLPQILLSNMVIFSAQYRCMSDPVVRKVAEFGLLDLPDLRSQSVAVPSDAELNALPVAEGVS